MMPLLQVDDLTKIFTDKVSLFSSKSVEAVQQISFSLEKNTTLAITGKNSSGKSTLAKMIVGIIKPTAGRILFQGKELKFGDTQYRVKHIRMIFQDPNASFNPRLNVGQILDAPLRMTTHLNEQERNEKIFNTLRMVGFYPDHANIQINTMTLSQKQRVALARAIILEPEIIILDDVLGSLDISVKTQLINLLLKLQERLGISYIYIGQNLGIIKHISDQLLVMDEGLMVEYGNTQSILSDPVTDITKRMVESYFD